MTDWTYTTGIPNAPNDPADDVQPMQNNFTSINGIIDVDHVGFNENNGGIHKQVNMFVEANPGVISPGTFNSGVLFAKTANGDAWPFWQNDSGVFGLMQFPPQKATDGYVILPGGVVQQWGRVTNPGTSGSVSFPLSFSSLYNIQLSLQRSSAGQIATVDNSTPPTTTGFNYLTSSSGSNFLYWFAIGA